MVEVVGVGGLERVEHQDEREQPLEQPRGTARASGRACSERSAAPHRPARPRRPRGRAARAGSTSSRRTAIGIRNGSVAAAATGSHAGRGEEHGERGDEPARRDPAGGRERGVVAQRPDLVGVGDVDPRRIGASKSAPSTRRPARAGCAHDERAGGQREQRISGTAGPCALHQGAPAGRWRVGRRAGSSGRPKRMTRPLPRRATAITGRPSGAPRRSPRRGARRRGRLLVAGEGPEGPVVPSNRPILSSASTSRVGLARPCSGRSRAPKMSVVAGGVGSMSRARGVIGTWRWNDSTPIDASVRRRARSGAAAAGAARGSQRTSPARRTPLWPPSFGPCPLASATSVVMS